MLIPSSNEASELPCARGGGEPSRGSDAEGFAVAGRWEAQSWTRRETLGLERRLDVLRDEGFVVMIMVGFEWRLDDVDVVEVKGVEGRYV